VIAQNQSESLLRITLSEVDLRVDGRQVLCGVSAEFKLGQWTAIVGPNGAGKSSLLRMLAGLAKPQAGQVTLWASDVSALSEQQRAQHVSWMSQQSEWSGALTVHDVVHLGRLPHIGLLGARSAVDEVCVQRAMSVVECQHLQNRPINTLSGGERQRALLARVLAVGAPVCLLDEPMTHLDPPHQRNLVQWMRQHVASGGTAVSVLHDLNLAFLADHVVLLDAGRLIAQGAPDDVALHRALLDVFDNAISIESVNDCFLVQYRL
jgi:iron complex transport system ATP-binding protein